MSRTAGKYKKERSVAPWCLFILLAAAFVLKLLVLVQLKDHPLTQPDAGLDTTAYVTLARQVMAGDIGLGPGLYYVSPLYIYFLAAILAASNSFTVVRLVQIALGTVSVGFIFLTARAWYGERAAWIAAILATCTGLFTFYEVLILQSSIDVFLTSAGLACLARAFRLDRAFRLKAEATDLGSATSTFRWKALSTRPDLWAGVLFGLQTLNRPNMLIAVEGVAIVTAIALRRAKPAALLIVGLLLAMAPVAIRNVIVAHEWSLVSSHGGLNFYIGNNERATGFYQVVPGVTPAIVGQEKDTRRIAERALGRPVSDAEVSDYFVNLALGWMKTHPAAALRLLAKKFAFAFHAQPLPLPHSYPFFAYDAGTALRFYAIGPWLLVPLGLAGLVLGADRARIREYIAWVSFVPAYAASVALFFVAERYRLPLLVPLTVGAGAALDLAWRAVTAKRWPALAMACAAVAPIALLVNHHVALDDGRWIEGLRLAERLLIAERYDEADRWANWLETHGAPRPGAGQYGVGSQLLALDRTDRALPYLQRAHLANPSDPRHDYAYGQALLKSGRPAEALPHLQHGFEGGVEIPAGGYDYALALKESGDLAGAAAAVRRIQPADNADPEAWLRLGRLAMEAKAPDVAEPFFRHAAEVSPELAAARQQYGLNQLVLRRYDIAARELGEASRLDPRDADSLSRLAYCELKLGRAADADAHARAALAIDPNDPLARQLVAVR
ncbi:MAG TPA: tetratricopeptide repeat protein [Vicinamibacterales bacterium]|nr:tetratricopeptide repeat protein [Vicinamibacterales bacterium]